MKRIVLVCLAVGGASFATDFQPYGFIKASVLTSSSALDSFGHANLVAPIRAFANPGTPNNDVRTSFQLSQTRLGFNVNKEKPLSGQLEVDFIDFEKATPVTRAVPRLRVANISYALDSENKLSIGQDWDVFSPGRPMTFNIVGLYFGAGNAGFLRPQFKWSHQSGVIEMQSALGLTATNATADDGDIERGNLPTVSFMASYTPVPGTRLGGSAIAGRLKFSGAGGELDRGFYGLNVFRDAKLSTGTEIHSELYYGENLGSVGALTLATGSFDDSRHEWGGFFTARQTLTEAIYIQGGVGYACVLDVTGSLVKGVAGYRVKDNLKISAAFAVQPIPSLDLFLELSGFKTSYLETSTNQEVSRQAALAEVGAVLWF